MLPTIQVFKSFVNYRSVCRSGQICSTCIRNVSQASKLNTILNGEATEAYMHLKEINRANSKVLKKKYDALLSRALAGGGEKGIERHVKRNKKMLVRDRIKLLLDKDTKTMELSPLAGLDMEYGDVPCAGVVTLVGKIHGIQCMVIGNDATVKSGSVYPITLKKQLRAQKIALENKLPCVYLVDSGGAFLPKQAEIFNEGGRSFYNQAVMSAMGIPQTAVVCGSCTAGGAYIPAMADESVILDKAGTIFLGGPPLVLAATGERVTAEQLGGATLHCRVSGLTDHFANTEQESIANARDIIATLNMHDLTVPDPEYDEPLHSVDNLNDFAPSQSYGFQADPHFLLSSILDGSRFHEFKALYGSTLLAGFGFVKGHIVGILASNGRLNGPAALKGSHFVQLCSQRGIPIAFLQHFSQDNATARQRDINDTEEYESILKAASFVKSHAQLMQAIACASVPSVAITTGGLTGSLESQALGSLALGCRFHFIFPNVKVGGYMAADMAHSVALEELQAQQGGEVDTNNLPDSFHDRKQELREFYEKESNAFYAASRVFNDGVILPTDTRNVLGFCLSVFEQEKKLLDYSNRNAPPYSLPPLIRM